MMTRKGPILVVDDDRSLSTLYRVELEEAGYRVSVANTAAEALARVRQEDPPVVVMDIRMPGMDGLELMGRILALNPRIHVVLNTAYGSYKDSFTSWLADAYVLKSSDVGPLLQEVSRLVGDVGKRDVA
jgi:DNA-binding NtrC family response regulator